MVMEKYDEVQAGLDAARGLLTAALPPPGGWADALPSLGVKAALEKLEAAQSALYAVRSDVAGQVLEGVRQCVGNPILDRAEAYAAGQQSVAPLIEEYKAEALQHRREGAIVKEMCRLLGIGALEDMSRVAAKVQDLRNDYLLARDGQAKAEDETERLGKMLDEQIAATTRLGDALRAVVEPCATVPLGAIWIGRRVLQEERDADMYRDGKSFGPGDRAQVAEETQALMDLREIGMRLGLHCVDHDLVLCGTPEVATALVAALATLTKV